VPRARDGRSAAEYLQGLGRPVSALYASPLQRTRESAEPSPRPSPRPVIDERVIEPTNVFEGKRMRRAQSLNWRTCATPRSPVGASRTPRSSRMDAAMNEAWNEPTG
jgi:broad specificity phosphatase PhoE